MKTVNELYVFLNKLMLSLKNVLAIPHGFLKCFIYCRLGILGSPWCSNSHRAKQELFQGHFCSLNKEKVSFLSIYSLPTHKENHGYLILIYNICHGEDIYGLVKLQTSSFCYYL